MSEIESTPPKKPKGMCHFDTKWVQEFNPLDHYHICKIYPVQMST